MQAFKSFERESETCLDLTSVSNLPKDFDKAPYWKISKIEFEYYETILHLMGRSAQAYRRDICCGFGYYTCILHLRKDGTVNVTNWESHTAD